MELLDRMYEDIASAMRKTLYDTALYSKNARPLDIWVQNVISCGNTGEVIEGQSKIDIYGTA